MDIFGSNMYYWRRLSPEERKRILSSRKARNCPWHSPPHSGGEGRYMVTASCYEHAPIIGSSIKRFIEFEESLIDVLNRNSISVYAWVVLSNHYHGLVATENISFLLQGLHRLHGKTSFAWNGEDDCRGRKVWFGAVETIMKSERHFWASMNYIHNNPVKHGYVKKWEDWPFSSTLQYLDSVGREEAERIRREYDISGMGEGWD